MAMLWSMFIGAFLASTILPGGSEVLLAFFVEQSSQQWLLLWLVASIGNTLGSITSFYLGVLGRKARSPEELTHKKYAKATQLIHRFGVWVMLFSWLPIIGDIFCILAGWFKFPKIQTFTLIFLGKTVRYFIVIIPFLYWG